MFRFALRTTVLIWALALGGCAVQVEAFKTKKVEAYGMALDTICKEVMFDTAVKALEARPELAVALPILCPKTIGLFMALVNQPRPRSLNINLVHPNEVEGGTEDSQ